MALNLPVQIAVDRTASMKVYLVEIRRVKDERGVVVFFDGAGGLYGAPPSEPSSVGRRPSSRQRSVTSRRQ